jgi:predicted DNA-binding protein
VTIKLRIFDNMNNLKKRVVTYLNDKYKQKLEEICDDREEKEALIVREIIKDYLDRMEKYKPSSSPTMMALRK